MLEAYSEGCISHAGDVASLTPWGYPNEWDYWDRPWPYMDALHNHADLKVESVHWPHATRVTIAVRVNGDRKLQYFPSLDVPKSASAASTWRSKKVRVVDGDGIYSTDLSPSTAVKVLLRGFGGPAQQLKPFSRGGQLSADCK